MGGEVYSSTLSMHLTQFMHRLSVLILTPCWFPSQIPVNRHWKSVKHWFVRAIDVVVVDSVAAMTTKAEIEGEMGDSFVGLQARLMSQALRKLTGAISKSNAVCIFINQLRERSALCTAIRKQPRVDVRSNSIPLSVWISAKKTRSKRVVMLSVT